MRTRRIPIVLSGPLYQKLEKLAEAEERDPWQQARFLLRRAIEQADAPAEHGPIEAGQCVRGTVGGLARANSATQKINDSIAPMFNATDRGDAIPA